jgi:hypothetical protein
MGGLRFIRAHTANASTPLWLPLFLKDGERFRAVVRQYAGPGHPLAVALTEEP